MRGNTANTFDPVNGLHGLHADLGIIGGDAGSVCLDIGGAILPTATTSLSPVTNPPAGLTSESGAAKPSISVCPATPAARTMMPP